jgi:hypothetical protein
MKKSLLVMAAVALVFGTANAANINARTALTINARSLNSGRVLAFGSLRSPVTACVRRKVIRLYRVSHRTSRLLARTRTDSRGRYQFRLRLRTGTVIYTRFAGSFYSNYGGQQVCRPSRSKSVIVR